MLICEWASLVAQMVKRLPTMQETRVRSLGWENPMDGGAWWAIVHGVTKSQTPLSDFSLTICEYIQGVNMGLGDGKNCFLEESMLKHEERIRVRQRKMRQERFG